MDKKGIIEKINKFLQEHPNFKEECEIVYLLAEIRKILEFEKKSNKKTSYKSLSFYCNWALHIHLKERSRSAKYISDEFNKSMGVIYLAELKKDMRSHDDFFKLEDLRLELKDFFKDKDRNLPQDMLNENKKWKQFKKLFLKIIAECHIKLSKNFKSL
ncbi:MAG: hypothetical protein GWO79_00190, partial [Actinobacteria bacterium]|nr:hypothetical protein [Actinomycetota bacterium]